MSFLQEFKAFVSRGNVVDLAVGVIIGGAFGKIVDSLVKDVVMPPISYLMSGVDVSSWKTEIKPGVAITWGNFLQATLNFLIIALVIFVIIRIIHRFRHPPEPSPATPPRPTQEELLTQIRDLLAQQGQASSTLTSGPTVAPASTASPK